MDEQTPPTFESLGLSPEIVRTLSELGYEAPTPIQARSIPVLMDGKDLIGQAQTGTGKTAAFALPLLSVIDPESFETQALVLAPTRELAMQVAEAIHSYSKGIGAISVLPIYGGAPIMPQLKRLQRGAQVVVGTPGRLVDMIERRALSLSSIRFLVLDEADEMLKMGFLEDLERILSETPEARQTALFSATIPKEIQRIASGYLRDPQKVAVEQKTMTAPAIEQRFLNLSEGQKLDTLTQLLELEDGQGVLIFRRTKNGAAELAEKLEGRGFAAQAMHGDMTQALRESVIRRLRNGQIEIVVATDVAARGLDVEQITHVVNYDIPYDAEAYVHRIGRTGRAGRTGVATLFVTPREGRMMREIERYTGMKITPMKRPTRADLAAKRVAQLKDSIRSTMDAGELDMYLELVEQLVDEGGHDIAEVAAAATKLAAGDKGLPGAKELERREPEPVAPVAAGRSLPRRASGDRRAPVLRDAADARQRSAPADDRKPRSYDANRVRLSIALGTEHGVRPNDIVGALANEGQIPGNEIGGIEIGDSATTVLVPERLAQQAIRNLADARYRGNRLDVRLDDGSPRPPARPRTAAGARGATRSEAPYRRERPRAERPEKSEAEKRKGERTVAKTRAFDRDDRPPRAYTRGTTGKPGTSRSGAASRTERPKAGARGGARPGTRSSAPASRRPEGARTPFYSSVAPGRKPRKDDDTPRGRGPKKR